MAESSTSTSTNDTSSSSSPPLGSLLTVVLATSFTEACPATTLIEAVVASFDFVPGLASCRLVVVADGYLLSTTRRPKTGRLLPEDEAPYAAYRDALRALAETATGGAWANAKILALEGHHGFSWAVKAALESGLVTTPHVLIVQHDRSFMRPFDLARALGVMRASDGRVRYLLLPTRSTCHHAATIRGRCGGVELPHVSIDGARLLQLGFWYDSTHLATVEHYRDFVLKQWCVKRGSFPEDTLGKRMLDALKRSGLGGLAPYHAYLWAEADPHADEERVVGHLDGKHWKAWAQAPPGGAACVCVSVQLMVHGPTPAKTDEPPRPLLSIILPIYNGVAWIDRCLAALCAQTLLAPGHADRERVLRATERFAHELIELSAFDDGSTDGTWERLVEWGPRLARHGMRVVLSRSGDTHGSGCGNAKNRAVAVSHGVWLAFQDVDDISRPSRLARQLHAARTRADGGCACLLGSRVVRTPVGSTARYANWANGMSPPQLVLHRFRECTLLMPTWLIHRQAFHARRGFRVEKCEDLLFLQSHVAHGGALQRCDEVLVEYHFHALAATHAIPRQTILRHRVRALERAVLSSSSPHGGWPAFTIWGAGRDGRDFFKALSPSGRAKVCAFCDVDAKKVGTTYEYYEHRVPIVHFTQASPPFVTCVALDRTNGAFEANLASLGLEEGVDYYLFG